MAGRRGRHRRRLAAAVRALRGCRPRRCHAGQLVAGQGAGCRPHQSTRRCSAASPPVRRTPTRAATATRSPSSPVRVEGLHRGIGGRRNCSPAARRSSPPPPSSTTTGWRSTSSSTATTPASAPSLWVVPANMASYTDIDALVDWVGNEQIRKPWAAIDSPQGRADPDAAVPVRRTAGGRRPVRRRCRAPRWR